jgi:RNA polymerase sigma factor (sigma-70 family)
MAAQERPDVPGPGTPTDEDLALQARDGSRDSTTVLLGRCDDALDRLVRWWSRRRGLRREELEEVRQEVRLGFLLAVKAYAGDWGGGPGRACFRALLNRVVRNHLENWFRQRRRAESHQDRSVDWASELDGRALNPAREVFGLPPHDRRSTDPVGRALWEEFRARLTERLRRLDATQRWLWEQVRWDGRSLRELAAERGLSYDKAKRSLRRVVNLLHQALQ